MEDISAKERHLELAGVIKDVHAKLRSRFKKGESFDEVWEAHCQDKDSLTKYANAMHELATKIWAKNNRETRIEWCQKTCLEYFVGDGLLKVLEKEKRKKKYDESVKEYPASNMLGDNIGASSSLCSKDQSIATGNVLSTKGRNIPKLKIGSLITDEYNSSNKSEAVKDNSSRTQNTVTEKRELRSDHISEHLETYTNSEDSLNTTKKNNGFKSGNDDFSQKDVNCSIAAQETSELLAAEKELCSKHGASTENIITLPFECRIRLLDVGSCYNPFEQFPEFISIAVDIHPAVKSVFECDFLQLKTSKTSGVTGDVIEALATCLKNPIRILPEESVHVVVFSLLLEYLPSAFHRWICCEKAHKVLMENGLLIIITPDSHHQNKNAPRMKSWKLAIESIGFKRWRYVKQEHLHCMAFRKVESAVRTGLSESDSPQNMLYISQDLKEETSEGEKSYSDNSEHWMRNEVEDLKFQEGLNEMPMCDEL